MFDITIYNIYKREWETHRCHRIESKPDSGWYPKEGCNTVSVFNGIFGRKDASIEITTNQSFYVGIEWKEDIPTVEF